MNITTIFQDNKENRISNFENPFQKKCVEGIRICMYKQKPMFNRPETIVYNGTIDFATNGATGEKKIGGNSFESICKQVQEFIDSLQ